MEILPKIKNRISYPVGIKIKYNIELILDMAYYIYELITTNEFKNKPISLIGRGSSGTIIASLIAHQLISTGIKAVKVHIINKYHEESHEPSANSTMRDETLIVVDDFIITGNTINEVQNAINNILGTETLIDILCVSYLSTHSCHTIDCKYLICNIDMDKECFIKNQNDLQIK